MSQFFYPRSFSFSPSRLHQMTTDLEKKYREMDHTIIERLIPSQLPVLLEKIRQLVLNEQAIQLFAYDLTRIEIKLLLTAYPYEREDTATLYKINQILIARYNRLIGKRAWKLFQIHFTYPYLRELLMFAFQKETEDYLGLTWIARNQLKEAIKQEEPIHKLSQLSILSTAATDQLFKSWSVAIDSRLEKALLLAILLAGLASDNWIQKESSSKIRNYLEKLTLEKYQKCLEVYLLSREYRSFHEDILKQSISKLGDPRETANYWGSLPADCVEKVIHYLNWVDFKAFFSTDPKEERFTYWQKYFDLMENVLVHQEPSVLIMYFPSFVVVEFASKGNAAYFYHQAGFEENILPKVSGTEFRITSQQRKLAIYKNTEPVVNDIPLFIRKLHHIGYWPDNFEAYMFHYLRGNFTFEKWRG